MYALELNKRKLIGLVPLSILILFMVSCGSSGGSTTTGAAPAAATATCAPNRFKTTTGTVQSVSGTTLLLKNLQGKNVQAGYTDKTSFQQEKVAATSALKEGAFVTIVVKQSSNSTYTATLVTLQTGRGNGAGGGFGGANGGNRGNGQGRNANCFRPRGTPGAGGFGNGGANGNGGTNSNTGTRGITGTVGQLSGNTLTVTDLQGSDYTVTLDSSTKIIQFATATASTLQKGTTLLLTGSDDGKGGITAQNITVLLPGTTGRPGR